MVVCIAVGGVSSSGKTTIVRVLESSIRALVPLLRLVVVHQDDYFKADSDMPISDSMSDLSAGRIVLDWDSPDSLHLDRFYHDLKLLKSRADIDLILVEGFMLYATDDLSSMYDIKVLLHGSLKMVERRRAYRSYPIASPNDDGGSNEDRDASEWVDPPGYVSTVVYPSYIENHRRILEGRRPDVRVIDTTPLSVRDTCRLVLEHVSQSNSILDAQLLMSGIEESQQPDH